jgi:hypothetical protein
MKISPEGSSYFFEVAPGYSIALMVDQAISKQKDPNESGATILDRLTTVRLNDSPISQLIYVNDKTQGRHFQSEHWSYRADLVE